MRPTKTNLQSGVASQRALRIAKNAKLLHADGVDGSDCADGTDQTSHICAGWKCLLCARHFVGFCCVLDLLSLYLFSGTLKMKNL